MSGALIGDGAPRSAPEPAPEPSLGSAPAADPTPPDPAAAADLAPPSSADLAPPSAADLAPPSSADLAPPSSADPVPASAADSAPTSASHRALVAEIWLVLGLSLGADAVYAVLSLLNSLSIGIPLRAQSTVMNQSAGSNSSWLNLAYALVGIAVALVPVALVVYLLFRSGESASSIGLDTRRLRREILWGAALAAVVGGAGLALYLAAFHLGLSVNVVVTNLPAVWWRLPVLVLAAVQNGVLEEVVVCGYLLHRLRQLGWGENRSLATSALLRGSYHLYQGFGGFLGNAVMGVLFGRLFQRRGRLVRLVLAHSLIDTGAFVGYVLLKGHVSWLP